MRRAVLWTDAALGLSGSVMAPRMPAARGRAGLAAALILALALILGLAISGAPGLLDTTGSTGAAPLPVGHAAHGLGALPPPVRELVSSAIGRDDPAYHLRGLTARNPAEGLALRFTPTGVVIRSGGFRGALALAAVGRLGVMRAVPVTPPHASRDRVAYAGRGMSQWYVNGPLGLEQGFLLAHHLAGSGPVSLALQASGSLQPRLRRGTVLFGRTGLSYGNLRVTDARGRVVPAWLSVMRREVLIQVDDARAAYPLRIDPLIARGMTLTPSDQATGEQFGFSVALSADGSTVLIGGPDSGAGSAWVFSRSGSGWSQQGAKLTSPDGGAFGYSVALSADGNTALIGSPNDNPGSAWIFNRSGSVWTQEAKLTPADETSVGYFFSPVFGSTVALSADGNTALIGSPGDTNNVGAASVFTRSGSAWTQQGSKLTVSGGSYQFGATVSLSADGSTALIGGHDTGNLATGWVFTRAGSAWTQGAQLTSPDGGTKTLALSSDGNTVLIGASGDAWVFARSGSAWAQQAKLTASDATGGGIGDSVALSSDGNTALIAGTVQPPGSIGPVAAMWLFTRSGSAWAQQGGANFTGAVSPMAFSSDATTAAISDLGYNGGAGGVDMFANVASTNSGGGGGTGGGGTGGGSGGTGGGSNNGGGAVNPSHLRVKISKATISKKHRSAKFAFRSTGSAKATRFQCALVSQTHGKKRAKPHFTGCKSGKAYKHLRHGKYVFEVRALTGSAIGPVARRAFSI